MNVRTVTFYSTNEVTLTVTEDENSCSMTYQWNIEPLKLTFAELLSIADMVEVINKKHPRLGQLAPQVPPTVAPPMIFNDVTPLPPRPDIPF